MRLLKHLDALAQEAILRRLEVDQPGLVRKTQDAALGDYQSNAAMPLAKVLRKPPKEIAESIAAALKESEPVAEAEVAGAGFVNLRLDTTWIENQLSEALTDTARGGVPAVESPETVIVDYSSPNIAKQMHVGHLRSTIIGDALVRILRFLGHQVTGDNHLGDWGTQFGLLLVGMNDFGDEAALNADAISELERVYKEASARAKEDDVFADRARQELAKLQQGDAHNTAMWERFVAATRAALEQVYQRLGVTFDTWRGESAYHEMLPGVVKRLLDGGLAREDDGAICVFFGDIDGAPKALAKQKEPFIVQKRDGAYLYSTTDIATVLFRHDALAADRVLYVVDKRQSQHFRQLFGLMALMGVNVRLEHVGFGTVMGTDGKPIRTRDASGQAITLSSLLDAAEEKARDRIVGDDSVRVPPESLTETAQAVGIGAVKYADLSQNRTSDYQFDLDKMVSFQGNAGPYLQYQHARVASLFRRAERNPDEAHGPIKVTTAEERALALVLLQFSDQVYQAADEALPHLISDHLYALARAFSVFFRECPVLKSEPEVRESRLALAALTGRQLKLGLGLLNITPLEQM